MTGIRTSAPGSNELRGPLGSRGPCARADVRPHSDADSVEARADYSGLMPMPWPRMTHTTSVVPEGLDELVPSQLEVLEAQLDRQESAMTGRFSNASTRAAVLIGASAALGGTELVTSSGNPIISTFSLLLYLLAAVCGLVAMRSTLTKQPDLTRIMTEYAVAKTVSMRQSLLGSRLDSIEVSRVRLLHRHRWLVVGFALLVCAWVASGAGTIYGLANPTEVPPTVISIEGGLP